MGKKVDRSKVARLFCEADGWHWCDDDLDYLDARGKAYATPREALAALRRTDAYRYGAITHYRRNGKLRRL